MYALNKLVVSFCQLAKSVGRFLKKSSNLPQKMGEREIAQLIDARESVNRGLVNRGFTVI